MTEPILTPEQNERVALLSKEELETIDATLLANARPQWRKVAMLVGIAMEQLEDRIVGIPDIFYSGRVGVLVDSGLLESQGDPQRMRHCEVRLPLRPSL